MIIEVKVNLIGSLFNGVEMKVISRTVGCPNGTALAGSIRKFVAVMQIPLRLMDELEKDVNNELSFVIVISKKPQYIIMYTCLTLFGSRPMNSIISISPPSGHCVTGMLLGSIQKAGHIPFPDGTWILASRRTCGCVRSKSANPNDRRRADVYVRPPTSSCLAVICRVPLETTAFSAK